MGVTQLFSFWKITLSGLTDIRKILFFFKLCVFDHGYICSLQKKYPLYFNRRFVIDRKYSIWKILLGLGNWIWEKYSFRYSGFHPSNGQVTREGGNRLIFGHPSKKNQWPLVALSFNGEFLRTPCLGPIVWERFNLSF